MALSDPPEMRRPCVHVVPYLTGYNCEKCGATPEQVSLHPHRIRAGIDRARSQFLAVRQL